MRPVSATTLQTHVALRQVDAFGGPGARKVKRRSRENTQALPVLQHKLEVKFDWKKH